MQFVDQLTLGIERREMCDGVARFQHGEKGEGVVGAVRQIKGDFIAGRQAEAEQARGKVFDLGTELGEGDAGVAIVQE